MPEPNRKWLFRVEDFEGNQFYLDENGEEGSSDDLPEFEGTSPEARIEGQRRADLWEEEYEFAARIVLESRGIVGVKP